MNKGWIRDYWTQKPMTLDEFLNMQKQLSIPSVRYTGQHDSPIKKVAIIGGSGIGFEYKASQLGADVLLLVTLNTMMRC